MPRILLGDLNLEVLEWICGKFKRQLIPVYQSVCLSALLPGFKKKIRVKYYADIIKHLYLSHDYCVTLVFGRKKIMYLNVNFGVAQ